MPTKFTDTPSAKWANLGNVGTIWKWDTIGVTPKALAGSFEYFTCLAYSGIDSSGSIEGLFENFECSAEASFQEDTISDIAGSFEFFECSARGTYVENWIYGSFEYCICEGYANMGIEGSFEYYTCEVQSPFGASVEGSFKELELYSTGNSTYVDLTAALNEYRVSGHAGASLEGLFKLLKAEGAAFHEIRASVAGSFKLYEAQLESGGHVVASLENLRVQAVAENPIQASLVGLIELVECRAKGSTGYIAHVRGSFRHLALVGTGTLEDPSKLSALTGALESFEIRATSISGLLASIDGEFQKILCTVSGGLTFEPFLIGSFKPYTMLAQARENSDTCEPYRTLEFSEA